MDVTIRTLRPEDAEISWKWRNDPEIWIYTDRTHTNYITKEIEQAWIEQVLKNERERRFAICIGEEQTYVGNIHISFNENCDVGMCHIFIGEKSQWGKGIATKSTKLLIEYVRQNLPLKKLREKIHANNMAAKIYLGRIGFKETGETCSQFIHLELPLT